ncbi:MAG: hypothetical protein R2752_18915 [Vicinamibacterales bacterium]
MPGDPRTTGDARTPETRTAGGAGRLALLPAPALPLVYFAGAHLSLGLACAILVIDPTLPGGFHYHPRLIALVHLVTLGWISGSILGAFYIVGPLALGLPLPARRGDALACAAFWIGTAAMVAGFWTGRYHLVGSGGLLVATGPAWLAARVLRLRRTARMPAGVAPHVALAFGNVLGAAALGLVMAFGRGTSWFRISPLAMATAHAHLAVIGWAVMLIVGLSYRLVPMFLPAAMPSGRGLAVTAGLIEAGTLAIALALVTNTTPIAGALLVVAALALFARRLRGVLANRRPRPAEMRGRDWATWQSHVALLWGVVACASGLRLAAGGAPSGWTWTYGVAGLLGFVSQMVVGIQGRLLPMHAWYRAMARLGGQPPEVSSHRLAAPRVALAVLGLWTISVPALAAGLARGWPGAVAAGAAALLAAVVTQGVHGAVIVSRAGASLPRRPPDR